MATKLRGSCPYCSGEHTVQLDSVDAAETLQLAQAAGTSGDVEVGSGAIAELIEGGAIFCSAFKRG